MAERDSMRCYRVRDACVKATTRLRIQRAKARGVRLPLSHQSSSTSTTSGSLASYRADGGGGGGVPAGGGGGASDDDLAGGGGVGADWVFAAAVGHL